MAFSEHAAGVITTAFASVSAYKELVSEIAAGGGGGGGSGTVTTISVVSAHGFTGTVATATTTPAITLGTSITGLLKGDGTSISAAGASDLPSTGLTITQNSRVIHADTQSSGTLVVDWSLSNWHAATLTASITTLTLSNPTTAQALVLLLTQGGSGSYTVTWPGSVDWGTAGTPTLTTTVGGLDIATFLWDGTKYRAAVFGLGF